MASSDDLYELWSGHLRRLGCHDEAACTAAFHTLQIAYGEPHRAYHTLDHLSHLFSLLGEHAGQAEEPLRLAFAAWYHDIVYDPGASDNEARSADVASRELLRLGIDPGLVGRVDRLIRATAAHRTASADGDDALFLDADIAILGASTDAYCTYVAQVRQEYAALDEAAWTAGRRAFLTGMLDEGPIFRTPPFEAAYGERARANLARELSLLGG